MSRALIDSLPIHGESPQTDTPDFSKSQTSGTATQKIGSRVLGGGHPSVGLKNKVKFLRPRGGGPQVSPHSLGMAMPSACAEEFGS